MSNVEGLGLGPGKECVCPNCGYKIPHEESRASRKSALNAGAR